MPRAKAEPSRRSPNGSVRACSASWPCPRRPIAKRHRCSCSATWSTFPSGGEVIIFDRSWYNRAGVEYVMGFCSQVEHDRFLELCPEIEKYIVDAGIRLIKIWLEVGKDEQESRFLARIHDPLRQWKLSPMDLESYRRWNEFSRARDMMLEATDRDHAPWYIVRSDDKRRARLNVISHILDTIPYEKIRHPTVRLPKRSPKGRYDESVSLEGRRFVKEKF